MGEMDPRVKIAAASGVLLGGILLAMLFRHDTPRRPQEASSLGERLELRSQTGREFRETLPEHATRRSLEPAVVVATRPEPEPPASVRRPMKSAAPPPALAHAYPDMAGTGGRRALGPMRKDRIHTIVDGDTLPALAERYLGSADRFWELYEANRNVLPSPELLPIGKKIKIPAGQPTRETDEQNLRSSRAVIPVHPTLSGEPW